MVPVCPVLSAESIQTGKARTSEIMDQGKPSCPARSSYRAVKYEVHWIDGDVTLAKRFDDHPHSVTIGRVPANVIAVGVNDNYVVAKQKDPNDDRVYYFYIDRVKDSGYANQDEITQGPMSEKTYLDLKIKYGFPEFSKEF